MANNQYRGGLVRQYQNTAVPGLSMLFQVRMSNLVPGTTTPQLFAVQVDPRSVSQLSPAQTANFAPTSSPTIAQNQAQQGLRFFATHVMLADPNGTLRTTANIDIQINNLTQNSTVFDSPFVVSPGAEPVALNQAAIYEISGGMGNTLRVNAVNPYDMLQVQLQMPGGNGTATGVTVALFGFWMA